MTCSSDAEPTAQIALKVNGQEIELNSFVQCFMIETVFGMLRSLRGVEKVRTLDLVITSEPEQEGCE